MASPIWQKASPGQRLEQVEGFMSGDDVELDRILLPFDIEASIAHVKGLASINLLSTVEADRLVQGLTEIGNAFAKGELLLDRRFEDGHSAIEYWLTEKLGDLGKKVHTGRSRNDQVLVATRLYMKQAIQKAQSLSKAIACQCLELAEKHQSVVMPGYTHLQRAVPSSLGMWYAAIAEAMTDNTLALKNTAQLIDSNPLGTAAGYGVNLPLDRDLTTELLGFSRQQVNPIYCQNSRGKLELAVLDTFSLVMLDIRRVAWDLSLFSTQEFGFVSQDDALTTGSSIMPNKRNPDFVELIRASYATLQGATNEIQSLLSLPSGYQRDLQFGKAPFLRATEKALQVFELFPILLEKTSFNADKMQQSIDPAMYTTDLAIESAVAGIPFREAYRQSAGSVSNLEARTPEQSLANRVSPGGCANLQLAKIRQRLDNQLR